MTSRTNRSLQMCNNKTVKPKKLKKLNDVPSIITSVSHVSVNIETKRSTQIYDLSIKDHNKKNEETLFDITNMSVDFIHHDNFLESVNPEEDNYDSLNAVSNKRKLGVNIKKINQHLRMKGEKYLGYTLLCKNISPLKKYL
ncbi:hypothetical protein ABEB36_014729 [Hypothenemus hampei]|uniref:Uncharacterized protein n=1 Tax=Hypothenemus hampei TaxID=57062 RepID=A0ABD1E2Z2_HYPHA